jgi:hypothetical protein
VDVTEQPLRTIEVVNPPPALRRCATCRARVYSPECPTFRGTVFAVDRHECTRVQQILTEARRGSERFDTTPEFVHGRLITGDLNPQAWVVVLQQLTRHRLVTRLYPMPPDIVDRDGNPIELTISYRFGREPEMRAHWSR